MKFTNEKELLDCVRNGIDLYSPSLEMYMFLYSEAGAICTYSIAHDQALKLSQEDEYWGAYLGIGGSIYDNPEEEFENEWETEDWINVSPNNKCKTVNADADNVICYIPDRQTLIVMQQGCGCNLDNDDKREGYDAYVDYTMYSYDGTDIFEDYPEYEESDEFCEEDGGDMLYKSEEVETWIEKIEDTIRMALELDEEEDVSYLILAEDVY